MKCRPCGKEWTGLGMCHCARCHRHFSTVAVFDAHQPAKDNWDCQDPSKEKYAADSRGIWKYLSAPQGLAVRSSRLLDPLKTARYQESETLSAVGGTS